MNITVTDTNQLHILGEWIGLKDLRPVVNGKPITDTIARKSSMGADSIALQFSGSGLKGGVFTIEIHTEGQERCRLRYQLRGFPEPLDEFGIRIGGITNLRSFLRSGYNSWDGSEYVDPEILSGLAGAEELPVQGYAMTQLLPRNGSGSQILGFERHDQFQHPFSFDIHQAPASLTIKTLWDRKEQALGNPCLSEWLLIFDHPGVEEALKEWARMIAKASSLPPRLSEEAITGWCSWYNLYGYITEENLRAHLSGAAEVARKENLPMRIFQIDDGFTPEMGDWLEVKPQFPHGMKPLLDEIRSAGFRPGLWIAPFMVGNRSRLFHDHPEYVLHDPRSGRPLVHWRRYGENRWFKRSEEYFVLDATHPGALDYLRHVFHTWRNDWGCEYFKTDFMLYGSSYGPDQAQYHTPGKTRIETWRSVAEMIRQEIGDATWLGCGCPLWAAVGLVDGIRIGGDVGVRWLGGLSAESLLRDLPTRNFANHILWQIDPDCVLLRQGYHYLSDEEVKSLALFAGMSGGVMMTSDACDELPPQRLRLWKLLLNPDRRSCQYPFLGKSSVVYERYPDPFEPGKSHLTPRPLDPVIVQIRVSDPGKYPAAVFLLNTGLQTLERSFSLESLGFQGPLYIYDWERDMGEVEPAWQLSATLPSHGSKLFFLSKVPLPVLPEVLP